MQTAKNIFNTTSPIRTYQVMEDLKEVAGHVAPEVLVQKVVARMFGKGADQGIMFSALTHALSVPYIGGFGFMSPTYHPTLGAPYSQQLQAGVGGVPAVLFARYLLELIGGEKLLHLPWDNVRDLMVTIISKSITRPALSTVGKFLPEFYVKSYNSLQNRFDSQSANSRGPGGYKTKDWMAAGEKKVFRKDV